MRFAPVDGVADLSHGACQPSLAGVLIDAGRDRGGGVAEDLGQVQGVDAGLEPERCEAVSEAVQREAGELSAPASAAIGSGIGDAHGSVTSSL